MLSISFQAERRRLSGVHTAKATHAPSSGCCGASMSLRFLLHLAQKQTWPFHSSQLLSGKCTELTVTSMTLHGPGLLQPLCPQTQHSCVISGPAQCHLSARTPSLRPEFNRCPRTPGLAAQPSTQARPPPRPPPRRHHRFSSRAREAKPKWTKSDWRGKLCACT